MKISSVKIVNNNNYKTNSYKKKVAITNNYNQDYIKHSQKELSFGRKLDKIKKEDTIPYIFVAIGATILGLISKISTYVFSKTN